MNRKIAIIEIDYHAEVLKNTCRIFSNTNFSVIIITKEKIAKRVKTEDFTTRFTWLIIKSGESISRFMKNNILVINKCDLIIFNTLASHFKLFSSIDYKPITLLRIHNANSYLIPGKSFKPQLTPYFIWKDVSHILRKKIGELDWFFRKRFLSKMDYLSFPYENIQEYVVNEGMIKHHKIAPLLPFTTYNPSFQKTKETKEIYITVPGRLDQKRRDYHPLINAFNNIKHKLNQTVVLSLLGRPKDYYGIQIINKSKRIETNNLRIKCFKKFVPFEVFDSLLKKTDFLILPLIIDTRYTIYKEKYGYTKISGSINDLIHYGKPAIITRKYPLNPHIRYISEQYDNQDELEELILDWVNNRIFEKYNKKINQSLSFYSIENISDYYSDVLNNLIENENDNN